MPKLEMIGGCSSEYSQSTKFEVSRRLRSLVLCSPSPTFPPLPSFRPALSFFFFAVRTLPNRISILDGNWSAGRWNERASCLDRRVLYCITLSISQERHSFHRFTHEWKLQLLCRVGMLYNQLPKGLTNAMPAVFGNVVEVIIR